MGQQDQDEADEEVEELQSKLASALCCLAETHMGEAADVAEVAEECETLLLRAAQAYPTSPEAMQVSQCPFEVFYSFYVEVFKYAPCFVRLGMPHACVLTFCSASFRYINCPLLRYDMSCVFLKKFRCDVLCMLQVMASLKVEQGRPEEALDCLRQSIVRWAPELLLKEDTTDAEDNDEVTGAF